MKRMNLGLSDQLDNELDRLSKVSGIARVDLVRFGIALIKLAIDTSQENNSLAIVDKDEKLKSRIIIAI